PSRPANAAAIEEYRIQRVRSCDEQPVLRGTAKCDIRHPVRDPHFAEQPAIRGNAVNTVARAAPYIAVFVHAQPVGISGLDFVKDLPAAQAAGAVDIEYSDVLLGIVRRLIAGLGYIQPILVRRESQPVRTVEIAGRHANLPRLGREAVQRRRLLGCLTSSLVVRLDSIQRIREPDRAVRSHGHVIRCVEPSSPVCVDEPRDAAVELRAKHAAFTVGTRNQPPLTVPGLSIGKAGRSAIYRHAGTVDPPQGSIARQVLKQKTSRIAHPNQTFEPIEPAGEFLQRRIRQNVMAENRGTNVETIHSRLPERADGPRAERVIELDDQEYRGFAADGAGAMAHSSILPGTILVRSKGNLAAAHL